MRVTVFEKSRPHRRPAALRHSRLQDGEAPDRPPHRADGGRGRRLPHRRRGRRRRCRSPRCCDDFDAVVLAGGAEWPRDLEVPGRELDGIHFAMDFLTAAEQARRRRRRSARSAARARSPPKGKHVVVIGGGDTGSDCIGTSNRQGAASVTQLEIMPQAAGAREQGADLAGLAAEAAHLVIARGRLPSATGRC